MRFGRIFQMMFWHSDNNIVNIIIIIIELVNDILCFLV